MTQIELETRLSEIEADYTRQMSDHDAKIKKHKIDIAKLHADHDMAVSKNNQIILDIERSISSLKASKLEKKAAVYKQFLAEQNDTL